MARKIIGVIVGYLIFAVSAVLLFQIAGRDPHTPAPISFMFVSFVYGAAFAALGGYVASTIAQSGNLTQAVALAIVIALGATISILSQSGKGAIWSQLGAIFIMAPSALIGGRFKLRQARG